MNSRLCCTRNWPELARTAGYCTQKLARSSQVSVRQLERFFLETFNQTPREWLRELRLRRALELLAEGSTVKEAAHATGFKQANHFCREFKRAYGEAPGRFHMKSAMR